MIKIFLLAIAIWLVITVLKRYIRNVESSGPAADTPAPEDMVQCAHCGVHLPASDSFLVNKKYYCCEAHSNMPPNP